jgi:N-acylneuraminate cytidylyltransferase
VSTDSEEIAQIARQYGAKVPRMRGPELSNDYVGIHPVIQDSIKMLDIKNSEQTIIMSLSATAVLMNSSYIKRGIKEFLSDSAHYPLLTLSRFTHPIERAYCATGSYYSPQLLNNMKKRTQDFEPKWFDAGQFCIAKAQDWLTQPEFKGPFQALIIPPGEIVDIDTYEDLEIVSRIISANKAQLI